MQDLWYKFSLNISKNLPQAIINCGQGAYTDSEHVAYISERMRLEVVAVAEAKGIDIHDADAPSSQKQWGFAGRQIFDITGSGCPSSDRD